jgi:hypothetical protein
MIYVAETTRAQSQMNQIEEQVKLNCRFEQTASGLSKIMEIILEALARHDELV